MTKIMLVEDDKSLREIYGVRLLAEGYDIVSAGDGEEALAMAIKDRPDLIVSDVMMPKISGFDMLDILRSTTETKDIKVIIMTALSSDEQRQRGEQLGADMYLVKSRVGIEDVVKAVHQVLNDKPGAAPSAPAAGAAASTPPTLTPPAPTPNQPVSDVASTIPEPTAPFTGQRPDNLGDRVIQPLKDNPRVSNVDVGELMDKEFATQVQDVENVADGASSAVPPDQADGPSEPATPPPAVPPTLVSPPEPVASPPPAPPVDPAPDTSTPSSPPVEANTPPAPPLIPAADRPGTPPLVPPQR